MTNSTTLDTPTKIRVLERMRELLSDPDRVVLDPMHYFETADGEEAALFTDRAVDLSYRVCFCGAISVAALEVIGTVYGEWYFAAGDIRTETADKVVALGIPPDDDMQGYSSTYVSLLTSALKQGRAVEVIDAVLADVRTPGRKWRRNR